MNKSRPIYLYAFEIVEISRCKENYLLRKGTNNVARGIALTSVKKSLSSAVCRRSTSLF